MVISMIAEKPNFKTIQMEACDFFLSFISIRFFILIFSFALLNLWCDVRNPNTSFNCFIKRIHPKLATTEHFASVLFVFWSQQ